MRKLIYRGSEQIFHFVAMSKNRYSFSAENDYSVQPSTWADYYEMIAFDKSHTNIVDAKDPLAKTNLRRVSMYEYSVPEELIRTQELRDKQALKEKILLEFQKKYIRGVYDKVASGVITLPENVEESAVEYAKAEYLKLFPPVIEEAPKKETQKSASNKAENVEEIKEEVTTSVVSADTAPEKSQ